jgi:hypothetical protein
LSAINPFYQALCFYRVIEGIKSYAMHNEDSLRRARGALLVLAGIGP